MLKVHVGRIEEESWETFSGPVVTGWVRSQFADVTVAATNDEWTDDDESQDVAEDAAITAFWEYFNGTPDVEIETKSVRRRGNVTRWVFLCVIEEDHERDYRAVHAEISSYYR